MNNAEVGKIFKNIVENLSNMEGADAMDIDGLLMNWNNSELNQDRNEIVMYPGRDGSYSIGREGGKVRISKKLFIEWILSDIPFDENIYGKDIRNDINWATARKSITEILG